MADTSPKFYARLLSWNVNGSKNLSSAPATRAFAVKHHIIALQETFETPSARRTFHPPEFLKISTPARETGGRPSGGLALLINQSFFAKLEVSKLSSPTEWILPVKWKAQGLEGGIIVNVYLPRHSPNFSLGMVDVLRRFLVDLRSKNPGADVLLMGDWNADFNRLNPTREEVRLECTTSWVCSDIYFVS